MFCPLPWDYNGHKHCGGDVDQLVESESQAADASSIPWCATGFFVFSQSQLSVQTLLGRPHSPRVQSHDLTSVPTLKIQSIGSHTSVWTHESTDCTVRNGQRCSCVCGNFTQVSVSLFDS